MVDRISADDNRRLADRLKDEARATRPEFSEALHGRICRALESARASAPRSPRRTPRRFGWLLMAVAVWLPIGVVFLWRWADRQGGPTVEPGTHDVVTIGSPDPPPNSPADLNAIAAPTARTVEKVGTTIDSTVAAGRWGYLDHDARAAIQLLKDQFPLSVASNH